MCRSPNRSIEESSALEQSVEYIVGIGGLVNSVGLGHEQLAGLFPRDFVRRLLEVCGEVVVGVRKREVAHLEIHPLSLGLDNTVESRDQQIVDQDADTGEWGLPEQISNSTRGRIRDDPQTLLKRAEDERVRQALDCGCDRDEVADVIDVCSRTTWHKEKRARAVDFPLATRPSVLSSA